MKGLLSKIEVFIGLALLLVFVVWAASKCNETRAELRAENGTEATDTLIAEQPPTDTLLSPNAALSAALRQKINERAKADSLLAAAQQDSLRGTPAASPAAAAAAYTRLYVTIDKLKLRSQPGLNSEVLGELKLFDRVFFLDEMTDTTYVVNLGYETAQEPYVKVKTKRGTVGWVYGAGVHYHKKKREGVLE